MKRNFLILFLIVFSFIFAQEENIIPFEKWEYDKDKPMEQILPVFSGEESEESGEILSSGWEHKLKVRRWSSGDTNYLSAQAWTKKTGAQPYFLDLWYAIKFNILKMDALHQGYSRTVYHFWYPYQGRPNLPPPVYWFSGDIWELRDGDILSWVGGYSRTMRVASGHMGYGPDTPGDELDVFDVNYGKKYQPDRRVRR
jgi:hypothetical protein